MGTSYMHVYEHSSDDLSIDMYQYTTMHFSCLCNWYMTIWHMLVYVLFLAFLIELFAITTSSVSFPSSAIWFHFWIFCFSIIKYIPYSSTCKSNSLFNFKMIIVLLVYVFRSSTFVYSSYNTWFTTVQYCRIWAKWRCGCYQWMGYIRDTVVHVCLATFLVLVIWF